MIRKQEIVLVLDNTVFNIASRICSSDIIENLSLICSQIIVPEYIFKELSRFNETEIEYKSRTQKYIDWIQDSQNHN